MTLSPVSTRVGGGTCIIATEQTTASTSYTTLTTPDQVLGLVLPTSGLIRVRYQALWKETVVGNAKAALFLGANQLKSGGKNNTYPKVDPAEAALNTNSNQYAALASSYLGLASTSAEDTLSPVTTGQSVGVFEGTNIGSGGAAGLATGICEIFAAAGTYDLFVKFKTGGGSTVSVKERKLWVESIRF